MKKFVMMFLMLAALPTMVMAQHDQEWLNKRIADCKSGKTDWVCPRWKECLKNPVSTDWICILTDEIRKAETTDVKAVTKKAEPKKAQKVKAKKEAIALTKQDKIVKDEQVKKAKKAKKAQKAAKRKKATETLPTENK